MGLLCLKGSYAHAIIVSYKIMTKAVFWYKYQSCEDGGKVLLNLHITTYMHIYVIVDDWKSIFGDPTKFGFGALTVGFALILLFQHMLYRRGGKSQVEKCQPGSNEAKTDDLTLGMLCCTWLVTKQLLYRP